MWVELNRRKIWKVEKNRCKKEKKVYQNIYSSSYPYNTTKKNNERKRKCKNQPSPGNLPRSSVPKKQKPKKWHFTHTTFLTMHPSWVSHVLVYFWGSEKVFRAGDKLQTLSQKCGGGFKDCGSASSSVGSGAHNLGSWVQEQTPAFWEPQPWSRECPGHLKAQRSSSCLECQFPLPIVAQVIKAYTQMPDYLVSNPDSNPLLAVWTWISFLTSFCLCVLTSKLRAILKPMFWNFCED